MQTPQYKLLCAFCARWNEKSDARRAERDLDWRGVAALRVEALLLRLPLERQDVIVNELLGWLAGLCRANGVDEPWFEDFFR